jgi:hypothetical protein
MMRRGPVPVSPAGSPFPVAALGWFERLSWNVVGDIPADLRVYAVWGFLDLPHRNALAAVETVRMEPSATYVHMGVAIPPTWGAFAYPNTCFTFRCDLPELEYAGRRSARRIVAFWRAHRGRLRKSRLMYDAHVDVRWRPPHGVDYLRWLEVEMPDAERERAERAK